MGDIAVLGRDTDGEIQIKNVGLEQSRHIHPGESSFLQPARAFHARADATGRVRSPSVERHVDGTISVDVEADWKLRSTNLILLKCRNTAEYGIETVMVGIVRGRGLNPPHPHPSSCLQTLIFE